MARGRSICLECGCALVDVLFCSEACKNRRLAMYRKNARFGSVVKPYIPRAPRFSSGGVDIERIHRVRA